MFVCESGVGKVVTLSGMTDHLLPCWGFFLLLCLCEPVAVVQSPVELSIWSKGHSLGTFGKWLMLLFPAFVPILLDIPAAASVTLGNLCEGKRQ